MGLWQAILNITLHGCADNRTFHTIIRNSDYREGKKCHLQKTARRKFTELAKGIKSKEKIDA